MSLKIPKIYNQKITLILPEYLFNKVVDLSPLNNRTDREIGEYFIFENKIIHVEKNNCNNCIYYGNIGCPASYDIKSWLYCNCGGCLSERRLDGKSVSFIYICKLDECKIINKE